jgi:hypothetical protein
MKFVKDNLGKMRSNFEEIRLQGYFRSGV